MSDARAPLVVILENDQQLACALALLLEDWGYRVVHAQSPTAAARVLGGEMPQVEALIVDYMLDDGFTGIKGAAAIINAIGRRVPTIVTTGHGERAEHENIYPVLRKPFDPSILRSWLARHVPKNYSNSAASTT